MKQENPHSYRLIGKALLFALAALPFFAQPSLGSTYYKEGYRPMFNPYPNDQDKRQKSWRIRYFGPVGIGIDLVRPGMTMKIWNVEKDSPADKTGKLKEGQIIESINGVVLKDYDPRILLGNIITEAEARDGIIDLKIKGEGNVRVQIPVMGAYSPTWPVNCPKSDKIVRNLADLIAKEKEPSWGSVLFMLSTGEEKDLQVVKNWMRGIETIGGMNWEKGYKGLGLCEYYLRTGDRAVLPVIKKMTEELKENMYVGGWSGRGKPAQFTYSTGTGQVHASGMHCMTFLLLARLCGVEVDDYMFNEALTQFYRFGGRGNVAYGNGYPEGGLRDNGKTSGLAVAMAVAAQLTPEGENSVYAKARDNSAMKAFYATNWFHAAHTGGGMGEIWHHAGMALVREKRPIPYRSYHDTRRWVMDKSRRHDGSIAIEGMDDRYNRSLTDATGQLTWGTYFALTYTYPRKTLQIWGAPRSPYAKTYQLPKRPWGTPADDIFNSPDPIYIGEALKLTQEDLLNETVPKDASLPVIGVYEDPKTTEKEMFRFLLHPEYAMRSGAVGQVVQRGWDHLVVPMLKSGDPRLRQAGLLALTGMFKGRALPDDRLTSEMFDEVSRMIEDPNESWWVLKHAVWALRRADVDRIGQHRDRLLEILKIDSDWVQSETIQTLAKISTEREHYRAVFPAIVKAASMLRTDSSTANTTRAIQGAMRSASREVKEFAAPILQAAYMSVPPELTNPTTGTVITSGALRVRQRIGDIMQHVPNGDDFIKRIPKETLASFISGKDSDMYVYHGKFEPNPKLVGTWRWAVWPTPNGPNDIDGKVKDWLKKQNNQDIYKNTGKDILVLEDGGKVSKSGYFRDSFWSGDMLVGVTTGRAVKMEVRTYDGYDFLIIEQPKFEEKAQDPDNIPKDFHPGFSGYIRAKE